MANTATGARNNSGVQAAHRSFDRPRPAMGRKTGAPDLTQVEWLDPQDGTVAATGRITSRGKTYAVVDWGNGGGTERVKFDDPAMRFIAGKPEAAPVTQPASTHRAVREAEAEVLVERSSPAARARSLYQELAAFPGDWVSLTTIRERMSDLTRQEQDALFRELSRTPGVAITPQTDQRVLTPADRAAAIHIGGKAKHQIVFREQ